MGYAAAYPDRGDRVVGKEAGGFIITAEADIIRRSPGAAVERGINEFGKLGR